MNRCMPRAKTISKLLSADVICVVHNDAAIIAAVHVAATWRRCCCGANGKTSKKKKPRGDAMSPV